MKKTYIEIYNKVLLYCENNFRSMIEKYYREWQDTWMNLDNEYYIKHSNRCFNDMLKLYDEVVPKYGMAQFMNYSIPSYFVIYLYDKFNLNEE